jgi:23S rRNA (uracil1939-C5)-methyltransferase
MKKNKIIECEIKKFNKDGHGIGYYNDIPVEVMHTMPGDKVSALLLRKSRGAYLSRKEELLSPSPQRIPARCPHFEDCGGCRLQHVPYEQQLALKEQNIKTLFSDCSPIIKCSPPWNYRNKMEFTFSQNKKGKQFLGLIIPRSRGMVADLFECHLSPTWFMEVVALVRSWWHNSDLEAYHHRKDLGSLRNLTLRSSSNGKLVMLTVSGNPDFALSQQQLKSFTEVIPEGITTYLQIQQIAKGKPTQFFEMHLAGPEFIEETLHVGEQKYTFRISPVAFFQPNPRQAEVLYHTALTLADINKNDVVWDLYCGAGTLGVFASVLAKEVVGIEITPESAIDAKQNVALNDIQNMKIIEGDVGTILKQKGLPSPDVIIVDPPRAGLDETTIAELLLASPKKIIYISCNPKTQAENLKDLHGYTPTHIQPVDMFPMTPHIENIIVLKRENNEV